LYVPYVCALRTDRGTLGFSTEANSSSCFLKVKRKVKASRQSAGRSHFWEARNALRRSGKNRQSQSAERSESKRFEKVKIYFLV